MKPEVNTKNTFMPIAASELSRDPVRTDWRKEGTMAWFSPGYVKHLVDSGVPKLPRGTRSETSSPSSPTQSISPGAASE